MFISCNPFVDEPIFLKTWEQNRLVGRKSKEWWIIFLTLDKLSPLPQSHAVCKMWSFGHASKGCALETVWKRYFCTAIPKQYREGNRGKSSRHTMKTWTGVKMMLTDWKAYWKSKLKTNSLEKTKWLQIHRAEFGFDIKRRKEHLYQKKKK